jgi:hypothetical protein
MPDWLIRQYGQEAGTETDQDEMDQDYQHCCVT